MRPPFYYYGSKQSIVNKILPLIPKHQVYCEPFFGSGALFWNKQPSKIEIINDNNDLIVNFYEVLKNDFDELKKLIETSLLSDYWRYKCREILKNENSTKVEKAFAFWYLSNACFYGIIHSGLNLSIKTSHGDSFAKRVDEMRTEYSERLKRVTILNRDAIDVIKKTDSEDTFFFLDPPYISSDKRPYKEYSMQDFLNLLECIKNINGKFLFTTYEEDGLMDFVKENNFYCKKVISPLSVGKVTKSQTKEHKQKKTEIIITNYDFTIIGSIFECAET